MSAPGVDVQITALLTGMNTLGGYPMSLVCTDQGLLIAASGPPLRSEIIAGLTSLFDDIVGRATRDLELQHIDEITLSDGAAGRLVIRPISRPEASVRLFLVAQVPKDAAWRRNTSVVARKLLLLRPWLVPTPPGDPS